MYIIHITHGRGRYEHELYIISEDLPQCLCREKIFLLITKMQLWKLFSFYIYLLNHSNKIIATFRSLV